MDEKQLKRFLSKVDKTDHQRCVDHGCWMWTAGTNFGYGKFRLNGTMHRAHRVAYEHFKGEIPEGMVVRHMCPYGEGDVDNRRCVNPDHLEVGTCKQNTLEGYTLAAKNAAKTCCPKCGGEYSPQPRGRYCRPCHNAYINEWKRKKRRSNL